MQLIPEFDAFATAYEAGENQVVYARLAADLDTPVSLCDRTRGEDANSGSSGALTSSQRTQSTASSR